MNPGTITDTLSWYKISPLHGFNFIRVEKISQETEQNLRKFPEPSQKRKVFFLTIHLNLTNPVKNSHHRTSTPYRSETKGIAERAIRQVKEKTSTVFLQSGLDEKWSSESMECYCSLRLRTNKNLVNHVKDQLYHLVHWWKISQTPRETKQEFINSERKYYQEFLHML